MPRRGYEPRVQLDFSRAVYEWAEEMFTRRGYMLQTVLSITKRPGVFKLEVRALHLVDGRPAGVAFKHWREWPNGDGRDFWAEVHVQVLQLDAQMSAGFMEVSQP